MILFTASYEGRSLPQFLEGLSSAGVRQLVDIREVPISRKRGFSKVALAMALSDEGISYRHLQALGCPKCIRDAYKADNNWARYTEQFAGHLQKQLPALEELRALVVTQPTALLCYEADFNRCHRSFVAHAVAERTGSSIYHITAAGLIPEFPNPELWPLSA